MLFDSTDTWRISKSDLIVEAGHTLDLSLSLEREREQNTQYKMVYLQDINCKANEFKFKLSEQLMLQ